MADPFILLHDGTYYAYGTKAEHGIAVFESDDLQTWRQASGRAAEGLALHKDDVYGDRWFWAPEVYCINGAFYMFFSAQSHVCVAVSDSPLGPFVQKEKKPMIEGEKCIDNTLFIDDDGRKYMYFDRFNDGLNIWMCELENDLLRIKPGTMQKPIRQTATKAPITASDARRPTLLPARGPNTVIIRYCSSPETWWAWDTAPCSKIKRGGCVSSSMHTTAKRKYIRATCSSATSCSDTGMVPI